VKRQPRLGRTKRAILVRYRRIAQENPRATRHPWRPTELARELGSTPAAVVRALDALVENGFMRVTDKHEIRRRAVAITPRGERRLNGA
jgi:DNA-binding MarR family transcriptional regulator